MRIALPTSYSINALKTFTGMEGPGFNCNLLRDGKKVAEVIDDASGGPIMIQWLDYKAPKVNGQSRNYKEEVVTSPMTPEEAILAALIMSLPAEPASWDESIKMFPSDETFISKLVDRAEGQKRLRTLMAKRVLWVEDGNLYNTKVLPADLLPRAVEQIKTKPGRTVLNGMAFDAAFEIAFAKGL